MSEPIKKRKVCDKCEARTTQWGTQVERKSDNKKFVVWECSRCHSLTRVDV